MSKPHECSSSDEHAASFTNKLLRRYKYSYEPFSFLEREAEDTSYISDWYQLQKSRRGTPQTNKTEREQRKQGDSKWVLAFEKSTHSPSFHLLKTYSCIRLLDVAIVPTPCAALCYGYQNAIQYPDSDPLFVSVKPGEWHLSEMQWRMTNCRTDSVWHDARLLVSCMTDI